MRLILIGMLAGPVAANGLTHLLTKVICGLTPSTGSDITAVTGLLSAITLLAVFTQLSARRELIPRWRCDLNDIGFPMFDIG